MLINSHSAAFLINVWPVYERSAIASDPSNAFYSAKPVSHLSQFDHGMDLLDGQWSKN